MSRKLIAWTAICFPHAGEKLELVQTLAPGFPVSDHRLVDLDVAPQHGSTELVVLGASGQVRVFAHAAGSSAVLAPEAGGTTQLESPTRSLVDLAHLGDRSGLDLVVLGPKDARAYPREGACFSAEPVVLAKRASHALRVGAPLFVDVVQDVNGDGLADLVVPSSESLRLWLGSPPSKAGTPPSPWPGFTPGATLAVEVNKSSDTSGKNLSDMLEASFSIPSIVARDVNGDGRADLLVSQGSVRAFHLQNPDATFPETPTLQIDLSVFRDTIEKAEIRPGHTLAIGDSATYETRDLDADGIPDYVIAHRRKVWVFHGDKNGPQFKLPSAILKTSDDITALQLVRLDGDKYPDLLLIKVQIPTIAALVRGVFGDWDVEVSAAGYLSKDGRSFEATPSKRAELAVRLPAILRLLKNPDAFLKRFEDIGARFRRSVWGDFDGNGVRDVALASEDGKQFELWLSDAAQDANSRSLDGEALLAQLLFEDQQRVWDIDRIAGWLGGLAERRTAVLTGGKPSSAQFPLRPRADAALATMEAADLDGDGRDELILTYTLTATGATVFDVLRLGR